MWPSARSSDTTHMVWMDLQSLGAICPPKLGLGNIWCNAQNIIGGRLNNSVAHGMVTLGVFRDKRHGLTRFVLTGQTAAPRELIKVIHSTSERRTANYM